jgi:hypothetical protein
MVRLGRPGRSRRPRVVPPHQLRIVRHERPIVAGLPTVARPCRNIQCGALVGRCSQCKVPGVVPAAGRGSISCPLARDCQDGKAQTPRSIGL